MKFFCAIASLLFLMSFNAFAQIPSDKYLRISFSETNFSGIISNTQPDVQYEIQRKQDKTNWISMGFVLGSEMTNWTAFDFRITNAINSKTIRIRSWIDSQGVGIPDWWQLKYFGSVGIDPYGNPEGDGWNNMQKFQNNMEPFMWYPPPAPKLSAQFFGGMNTDHKGSAILTWQIANGPVPDFFLIERANRTLRPITNNPYFQQPPPGARFGANGTNRLPFDPRFGSQGTNRLPAGARFGVFGTNRPPPYARVGSNGSNLPPNFRPMYGRPPGSLREDPLVMGPFVVIARIPGRPGVSDYRYVETNVDTFFQPSYRIQPHYSPPLHAHLNQVDAAGIRRTILSVAAQQTTNGYALTALHPIPYARYLLLVRDKNDPQWRASGYFASGTNRDPVYIQVDKKGMMSSGQSPIAMPEVKFLRDVVEPEFTAGWGEDSDGDGLPDIYEVLVTHTDPDNADTGDTGNLDGDKDMSGDGWNNLEKFRHRADPTRKAQPPAAVELIKPNDIEIWQALLPKSDLPFDVKLEVRVAGSDSYQPIEQIPSMIHRITNSRQRNERRNFDLLVAWQYPAPNADQTMGGSYPGMPASLVTLASLENKADVQVVESFGASLAARPPLSHNDMTNYMASIDHAFRQDDIDQSELMGESMALQDNQSQDFYGKVVDQHGQPVIGADVTVQINLGVGRGSTQKVETDGAGLFECTGLRGQSLTITLEKKGFQIEGHGLGQHNGTDTAPDNRMVFTMWKLKGPEPMLHNELNARKIQPDGRVFTIDFLKNEITEGTNVAGDILVQIKRPPAVKPREQYDWSFVMTAIDGGFIEVTNDIYLNEAPQSGYQQQYQMNRYATNVVNYSTYPLYRTDRTFFLKSRGGKVYGHFHINELDPDYRGGMASLRIESYINPAGSRNLEFDPAKQTEYTPKAETVAPLPPTVTPKTSRIASTNVSGQIVGWGSMVLPQFNPGTHFIAVAGGGEHSLALKSDGTVVAWGRNLSGEATVPAGLSNVIAIAAGGRSGSGFNLALKRDGRVIAWGDNAHLQTSVPDGLSNVVAITTGTDHCLALKKDGTVIGWGINEEGMTQSPIGLSNVVAVAAGEEHSVALKSDGTLVAWGRNQHGQASVPEGLSNVVSICSGSYFNLALKKDGTVVGWGIDVPKDLTNITAIAAGPWDGMALRGDGTPVVWGQTYFSATQVPSGVSNIIAISGGGNDYGDHSLALREDGTIVGWGNNNYGQSLSPDSLTNIVSIAGGLGHYLAIRTDGSVVGWGGEDHQGDGQAWVPAGLGPVSHVAGGWYHSLAVRSDGTVVGWGFGAFGQTAPPGNLTGVTAIATGYNHSLALKDDGTVIGWGNSSSAPQSLSNVVAIAAATSHSIALKHDGTVVAWGQNGSFQKNVPDDLTDVVAIAADGEYAGDHDLALKRDGTVIAWGSNGAGQTNVPAGLTNVIAIAAGANHSLALRRDGTLVAWGANNAGQATIPPGLSNVVAIAAGGLSSIAIVVQPRGSGFHYVLQFRHELIVLIVALIFCLVGIFWLLARHYGSRNQSHSSDQ
jgi:alpha-tubulin suppressor-like RCC1 family protein